MGKWLLEPLAALLFPAEPLEKDLCKSQVIAQANGRAVLNTMFILDKKRLP